MRKTIVGIASFLLLVSVVGSAQTFAVPSLKAPVNDYAGMIAAGAQKQINQALRAIQDAGGSQIAVLTIPNLSGLTIEQASIQIVEKWKLGTAQKDNGVLLLIARDERQVRIEVGQGVEGDLTDAYAKRIIDETMVPLFKVGNISEGVLLGVYQIAKTANPNLQVDPYFNTQSKWRPERNRSVGSADIIVIVLFVCFLVLVTFLGGGGNSRGRRSGWGTGYMGGGGGFGGRSSGGGFSGGGGGFSGGGASGRW